MAKSDLGRRLSRLSPEKRAYVLRDLLPHLVRSGDMGRLTRLLTTLPWLEAKVEAGLVFDLTADFGQAVAAVPASHPKHHILRLLGVALRRDIHFIARHPSTLFQCLWNNCWWETQGEENRSQAPTQGEKTTDREGWRPLLLVVLERWWHEKRTSSCDFTWVRSLLPPSVLSPGSEKLVLRGHRLGVHSLAASADGQLLVSGGWAENDSWVRFWEVPSGKQVGELSVGRAFGGARTIRLSEDRRLLVLSGGTGWALEEWIAEPFRRQNRLSGGEEEHVSDVALSGNGQVLAVLSGTSAAEQKVTIRDTAVGEMVIHIGREAHASCLALTHSGLRLACGYEDGRIGVWGTSSGRNYHMLSGHEARVRALAFLKDGWELISGADDGTVRVWNTSSGKELRVLKGHTGAVCAVAFLGDLSHIVSGDDAGVLRIWDMWSGEEVGRLEGHEGAVHCIIALADGAFLASGSSDQTIRVWDVSIVLSDEHPPQRDQQEEGGVISLGSTAARNALRAVPCLCFSPDDRALAVADAGGNVYIVNCEEGGGMRLLFKAEAVSVYGLAFSPTGKELATASSDGKVRIWDLASSTARVITSMKASDLVFAPDGKRLAVFGLTEEMGEIEVTVHGTDDGEEKVGLSETLRGLRSLAFSPHGMTIATAEAAEEQAGVGRVALWDAMNGELLSVLDEDLGGYARVAFNADGTAIAAETSRSPTEVRVWSTETLDLTESIEGANDAPGIARGGWRTYGSDYETVFARVGAKESAAWFPRAGTIESSPCGTLWAIRSGSGFCGLHLVSIEGG